MIFNKGLCKFLQHCTTQFILCRHIAVIDVVEGVQCCCLAKQDEHRISRACYAVHRTPKPLQSLEVNSEKRKRMAPLSLNIMPID